MVILVNEQDEAIGTMPKLPAHEQGLLHRAFSVFIFNPEGKLLIQQRALDKYHTPGQWANSCCSHPQPGETARQAALRRLDEEMGMQAEVNFLFKFTYKAPFANGLTEHEIDHVFAGISSHTPAINKSEVNAYQYMSLDDIREDMGKYPDKYTAWFTILISQFQQPLQAYLSN